MLAGAAIIFFAYIGFDAVSTQAEEAKNPQRDVPIGIIASLVICTVLYIAVVAVLTGMVPYDQLDTQCRGLRRVCPGRPSLGQGQSSPPPPSPGSLRCCWSCCSDPRESSWRCPATACCRQFFADVHPTFATPWKSTLVVGLFVALMAGLLPLGCAARNDQHRDAVRLRRRLRGGAGNASYEPDRPPAVSRARRPLVAILGMSSCLLLMLSLPAENWLRLFVWMAIGLVIYFGYGRWHSKLNFPK